MYRVVGIKKVNHDQPRLVVVNVKSDGEEV